MSEITETGRRRARKPPPLDPYQASPIVVQALHEDIGTGDVTTRQFVSPHLRATGLLRFHEEAIVAGLPLMGMIFTSVDRSLKVDLLAREGDRVSAGTVVAAITGGAASILTGERVALNFLQRLSGIASLTRLFVEAVAGTGAKILDTRKTTPGLRYLEKYAVRVGGGVNHRIGLFDGVLVKDNHLHLMTVAGTRGRFAEMVAEVRALHGPGMPIEAEAKTLDEVREVLAAGVDIVLLDNMDVQALQRAMREIDAHNARAAAGTRSKSGVHRRTGAGSRKVLAEASGGVTLATVEGIARTGVDRISIGALTHSARAIDISMDVEAAGEARGDHTRSRRRR